MVNTKKLRQAIKTADVATVTEILRAAPKEGIRLAYDWTPLHVAARQGSRDVVAAILEAGAEINATSEMHQTPLDIALQHDHKGAAELLRKRGAKSGPELALHPAVAAGDLKAVKKHVQAGADADQLVNGERPLCLALQNRRWDVVKYLMKQGCDVTKAQRADLTPLHLAASSGAPEPILAKLLKLGAHIDAADSYSWTPLCYAAEAGNTEILDWLLDHGADVTRGRETSSTPVYCALRGDHVELAAHLIDRGGKSTLHQAVQCNHLARARQKLNAGADVNNEEDPRVVNSPLATAIWRDHAEMVELLLEFGADPNQQDRTSGNTALHEAVHKGSARMVKILLAHGADPDIADAGGETPIQAAERRDRRHLAHLMEAHMDKQLSLEATQNGIEQLYPVQKVAELLSVDDAFVLELIRTHKVTGLHLDEKTLRIPAGSVQRYLAKLAR